MLAMPCAGYTAFMYVEAGMLVSWEAVLAWAADTELLEPLASKGVFCRVRSIRAMGSIAFQITQSGST